MDLMPYAQIAENFFEGDMPGIALEPGTALSFPVPTARGGELLEAVFLYRRPEEEFPDTGPRPYAWVQLSAVTGHLELFSTCRTMDFISTERYPLEEDISMELPRRLAGKKYTAAAQKLMELYEHLRTFVFEENLSREQVDTIVAYKEHFQKLVYTGHYPFYHALSPEFFHWLRLPLPQAKPGQIPKDAPNSRENQYQLLILENLQQLVQQFQNKIAVDAHKEKLFDQLHTELQEHKNGMIDSLTRSMEMDVIHLIDNTRKTIAVYRDKPANRDNCRRLLKLMEGVETDLCDLLYRQGVEPYSVPYEQVEVPRQKVVATVSTPEKPMDKLIASRLATGWDKNGKTIRPEWVSVYVYDETMDEPDEPSDDAEGQREPAGAEALQSEDVAR